MVNYAEYARQMRHELHQIPELGFDLPKTTAVVKRELEAMGIEYTEKYGKGSVVAYLGKKEGFTIGIRADMDALPIQEAGSNPYRSTHDGQMHACGHDAHTANLLAVTRKLKDMESQLRCRVKLIFQPAEEYITPGAKLLVENGVMDDVDCAFAGHVSGSMDVGNIGVRAGGTNANSMGIVCEFFGKSAHAHTQHKGIDAIRMAMQAYMGMEMMVAREVPSKECVVFNVGQFNAGNTNNIVCDYARMFLSARSWSDETSAFLEKRVREICEATAQMCGGECKVTVTKLIPFVINNETMVEKVRESGTKTLGEGHVKPIERTIGGEDFAFMSRKKPGVMIRLGAGSDEVPESRNPLHNAKMDIDERCFDYTVDVFVNMVLDNQDGIEF